MKNLLISGNTLQEWNLDELIGRPQLDPKERIYHFEVDNTESKTTANFTYADIDWINLNKNRF